MFKETENKILFMHKYVFTLPVTFAGSYTEDENSRPLQDCTNHGQNVTFKRALGDLLREDRRSVNWLEENYRVAL